MQFQVHSRKIAVLLFDPETDRGYSNSSFDKLGGKGIYILIDALKRNGITVDFVNMQNCDGYDIVLISLISVRDVIMFLREAYTSRVWKNRKFKTLAGGFGANNAPVPLFDFVDYIYFGRAENEIVDIINSNLDFESKSLLNTKSIKSVEINQASEYYPFEYAQETGTTEKESNYGCPNKCFYCAYSFTRKYIKNDGFKILTSSPSSVEVDWNKYRSVLDKMEFSKIGKIVIGLDGWTENTRFFYNRKYKNDDIVELFTYLSERIEKEKQNKSVRIKMFNLTGSPIATKNDIEEFKNLIEVIDQNLKQYDSINYSISILTNIIEPQIATPSYWYEFRPEFHHYIKNKVVFNKMDYRIMTTNRLVIFHDIFNKHPITGIENVALIRGIEDVYKHILFNKNYIKQSKEVQYKMLMQLPEMDNVLRRYSTNEEMKTDFVRSYIPIEKLKILSNKQLEKYEKTCSA